MHIKSVVKSIQVVMISRLLLSGRQKTAEGIGPMRPQ